MSTQPPKIIYLIQEDSCSWLWCEDPAPGTGIDADDATKYIRMSEVENLRKKLWDKSIDDNCIIRDAGVYQEICAELERLL